MKNPFHLLPKCHIEFPKNSQYEIFDIDARKLLTSFRFDLYAKLLYIDHYIKGLDMAYAREIYSNHIEIITGCSFIEKGQEDKNSLEKYLSKFNELIAIFKKGDFDSNISLIPLDCENIIIDGAHRLSCAAYFNKNVTVIKFTNWKPDLKPDWEWFNNRHLANVFLDAISLESCNWHKDIYMACFWPKVSSLKKEKLKADELLMKNFQILSKKTLKFSYRSLRNLLLQIYGHMDWIGNTHNHFNGILAKVNEIYDPKYDNVEFVLFRSDNYKKVYDAKQNIRNIFNIGLSSIHTTDNYEETKQIAELIFNPNSVHHLRNSVPDKFVESYNLFEKFTLLINEKKLNQDLFILDSSMVLALYGIRKANDLDFLTDLDTSNIYFGEKTENHIDHLKYHIQSLNNLLYLPTNYFIFNKMKILSLDRLKEFKTNRAEPKDLLDLKVIDSFYNKSFFSKWKIWILTVINKIRMKFYVYELKSRILVFDFLKHIGLYDTLKKIYMTCLKLK